MSKIITKKHQAVIEELNSERHFKLLDSGTPVAAEAFEGRLNERDIVDTAKSLAEENYKIIKLSKTIKNINEEFAIELKYLV